MDVECFKLEIARVLTETSALIIPLCHVQLRSKAHSCHHAIIVQNIHTLSITHTWPKGKKSSIIPIMILEFAPIILVNPSIHPGKEWIVRFVSFTTGDNPSCQGVNMKAASHWLKTPNGPRWSGVGACYLSARIPLRCNWCHLADFWSASAAWLILDSNLIWWSLESLTTKKKSWHPVNLQPLAAGVRTSWQANPAPQTYDLMKTMKTWMQKVALKLWGCDKMSIHRLVITAADFRGWGQPALHCIPLGRKVMLNLLQFMLHTAQWLGYSRNLRLHSFRRFPKNAITIRGRALLGLTARRLPWHSHHTSVPSITCRAWFLAWWILFLVLFGHVGAVQPKLWLMTYTCHSLHLESWCKIRLPFLEASESLVKDPKGFCLLLTGTSANAIKIENILAAPPKMCAANGFLHVNHKKKPLTTCHYTGV